jgi:hypothetical protein
MSDQPFEVSRVRARGLPISERIGVRCSRSSTLKSDSLSDLDQAEWTMRHCRSSPWQGGNSTTNR